MHIVAILCLKNINKNFAKPYAFPTMDLQDILTQKKHATKFVKHVVEAFVHKRLKIKSLQQ